MERPKTIGRYEILEELGHGAMGTVYRAKDPAMDRVVALKTINAAALMGQRESESRERFFREARAAGRLAHPGIVPVFDVGEHEGMPFLVMELISGETLADKMKSAGRLPIERVCELGQQIAEALGYAHRHGVVHRDIKPANILLTSREVYGIERPKITDFGVAKLTAGQITLSGQMVGTPAFMPPEQFTGAPIDGRADLFSVGVILYWMATGEQPFSGETITSISYRVVHTEPAPPKKINPSIPPQLDRVILKCLEKNPAERYQNGEDLARDLSELRTSAQTTIRRVQASPSPEDVDATLDWKPNPPVVPPAQDRPNEVTTKSKSYVVVLVAVVAIGIAAGGRYLLHDKSNTPVAASSAAEPVPTGTTTLPVSKTNPTPGAPTPLSAPVHNGEVTSKPAETNPATAAEKANALDTTAKVSDVPAPAKVDFDPSNLPANESAKLKIETERIPAGLDLTVEMNGKIYFSWNTSGKKDDEKNLFVPPGIHEFRAIAKSGSISKESNIVSTEFKTKKKKTLKLELRDQRNAGKSPSTDGLSETSQIFATLK